MEPICPAIIGHIKTNDTSTLQNFRDIIRRNLKQRSGGFGNGRKYARSDADVTQNLFDAYNLVY